MPALALQQIKTIVLASVLIAACDNQDRSRISDPSSNMRANSTPFVDQALNPMPEIVDFVPAVRISTPVDPLPAPRSDDELIDAVTRAGGRVIIGIKPPGAPRTHETGVVPGIDRATALLGRAQVQSLGIEITMTYRHSSAVVATIPPALAPILRSLPVVDYVEASFPGTLMQAQQPQDTSWGVKRVSAHLVWPGSYGPATRGEGAFVTVLDGGIDSVHRWSLIGDGPENLWRVIHD